MATFAIDAEQAEQYTTMIGVKVLTGTVTMNNAAAGGYVAAGEALDLSAFFPTRVFAAIQIGGVAASQVYLWGATTGANVIPLITATWTGPVVGGVLADVTAATDLSAATTRWMFMGF
jgi:hypothetical protein